MRGASEWGPDYMWCRAAKDWLANKAEMQEYELSDKVGKQHGWAGSTAERTPCLLVATVALHGDTRTIDASTAGNIDGSGSDSKDSARRRSVQDARAAKDIQDRAALAAFERDNTHARWMRWSLRYRDLYGGPDKSALRGFFAAVTRHKHRGE